MFSFSLLLTLLTLLGRARSATRNYNFTVEWLDDINPDGETTRQVVGINGQFPLPVVECNKGDRLVINVYNNLGDRNATIHWHGMYQNGTSYMDGPPGLTQCPIAPGGSMVYNFTVDQNGTYWYHTHIMGQYPDGYRGLMIVNDDDAYFKEDYDEEVWLTISDWYHDLADTLDLHFLSVYNPSGAEPVPDSMLFNDTTKQTNIHVEPGKTYLFRVANIGAFSSQYFWIEDHNLTVVEVDGIYTDPYTVEFPEALFITTAQRYAFLVTAKNTTDKNFPIVTAFDQDLFDIVSPNLQLNLTNYLEYNSSADYPPSETLESYNKDSDADNPSSDKIPLFDDFNLVPADHIPLFENVGATHTLEIQMINLDNGAVYAFLNNISYVPPKVPTLYTAMDAGNYSTNEYIYGTNTHTVVLNHMDTIEIVLNNADTGTHPFHLHGHSFQVVYRDVAYDDDSYTPYNGTTDFPAIPMRRDTSYVRASSSQVIRFVADNPGVWFFHCHIDWHLTQGLAMVFLEAPELLQGITIPDDHIEACKFSGMQYSGNAAGNADLFDLTGQNVQVGDLPNGFTARGIVAMVFSCVSAFLGMACISWYGLSDISGSQAKYFAEIEREAGEDDSVLPPPEELDAEHLHVHHGNN